MTSGAPFLGYVLLGMAVMLACFATFLIFHSKRRPCQGFGSILTSLAACAFCMYHGLGFVFGPLS